jgi:thiamine pyrophosphokinase
LNDIQRAIIFANGNSVSKNFILDQIRDNDIIIAADGGTQRILSLGLLPNVIIGDLDSIQPQLLRELKTKGVLILDYPARKDETDLELALLYVKRLGIKITIIHNALGARWDMTLANLLLPGYTEFQDMDIRIVDDLQEIILLRGEATRTLLGNPGDTISLIPVGGKAEGITSYGLEYHLENDSLDFGSPRGVSNVMLEDIVKIHLKTGQLVCVHIKRNSE